MEELCGDVYQMRTMSQDNSDDKKTLQATIDALNAKIQEYKTEVDMATRNAEELQAEVSLVCSVG